MRLLADNYGDFGCWMTCCAGLDGFEIVGEIIEPNNFKSFLSMCINMLCKKCNNVAKIMLFLFG